MRANELFKAGRLDEAIESRGVELRDNPTDAQRRIFLFELLCFAGKYDRAEKQLHVLSQSGPQAEAGALVYHSALHADRTRAEMFEKKTFPVTNPPPTPVGGTMNGNAFSTIEDGDPRLGARLEVYAAGQYTWLPFEKIESVTMQPPKRLRDLLWIPAIVRAGSGFQGIELGEVLLPVMTPLSFHHANESVRLGRVTEWEALDDDQQAPVGQKLLLVDGEEFPLLEIRELVMTPAETGAT
jgi:type VI secretion system protein ImpE